jgi:Na+/H+-dicarboxylate symporter
MAGLIPPPKPLTKSRTIAGTGTAAIAGSAAVITLLTDIGIPAEVAALLPTALSGLSDQATAAILLTIAAVANIYAAWARADDKAKGRL